jgi:hypothetical protein
MTRATSNWKWLARIALAGLTSIATLVLVITGNGNVAVWTAVVAAVFLVGLAGDRLGAGGENP